MTLRLKNDDAVSASLHAVIEKSNHVGIEATPLPLRQEGWVTRRVVFDVPDNAVSLDVSLQLNGQGTLWTDDFALAAVGRDVPLSRSVLVEREVMIAESNSGKYFPGGPIPGDSGPIMLPWMLGGDHSMDKSFASPTREAR